MSSPEVEVLKSLLAHPAIINCFAYLPKREPDGGDCVFFEYCPRGDLFNLQSAIYKKNDGAFPESLMWVVFHQLASAIAFLHQGIGFDGDQHASTWRPVIHRNIKVENVFISKLSPETDFSDTIVKLGDFGLATFYDPANARMPLGLGMIFVHLRVLSE